MTTYWHDDPATHPPVGTMMWHLHHEVLCELLTEPLANRLHCIRMYKPKSERETRLGLIDIVTDLPAAHAKAWAAYAKAWAAYAKAWAAYAKAQAALDKAQAARDKAWDAIDWNALHIAQHPNCPWNGRTIFPK